MKGGIRGVVAGVAVVVGDAVDGGVCVPVGFARVLLNRGSSVGLGLRVQTAVSPVVGQGASVAHRSRFDVGAHRHIQIVELDAGIPRAGEVGDQTGGEAGGGVDHRSGLGILAAEGDGDGAVGAGRGLEGAADGAGGEVVDGGGIAAVVGAGDDEVDGPAIGEEVEEAELDAAGGGAVGDHHPLGVGFPGGGGRIPGAVVAKGGFGHVGGCEGGFDQVGFADAGAGGGGDGDGDLMAGGLEGVDEGTDVGRESVGRRAIVIDHLIS